MYFVDPGVAGKTENQLSVVQRGSGPVGESHTTRVSSYKCINHDYNSLVLTASASRLHALYTSISTGHVNITFDIAPWANTRLEDWSSGRYEGSLKRRER